MAEGVIANPDVEGEVLEDREIPLECWPFVSCLEDCPLYLVAL